MMAAQMRTEGLRGIENLLDKHKCFVHCYDCQQDDKPETVYGYRAI
jgi:hypothetical protein